MKVVVTGAAGQISYSLIPFLCENGIFKSNEKIDFSLVEIPSAMEKLSGFKKPKSYEIWEEELPRLPTGKIQRNLVKKRFW